MSVNSWEVYIKCPVCGEVTTAYDYHENTSSEREELFVVLNAGKASSHLHTADPAITPAFVCSHCTAQTPYTRIFTRECCRVENLDKYKQALQRKLRYADGRGRVSFSDWDPDWGEEPALSRLISMYPGDAELGRLKSAYHLLHTYGPKAITRCEIHGRTARRSDVIVPEALTKVYLGNRVETIEAYTFQHCEALKDIYLPESVTQIGEYAFSHSGLQSLRTSDAITHIGAGAFSHTQISRFFFPKAIREIGGECFKDCRYLDRLWIPKQVSIGKNAFAGCLQLKHIQIHESISAQTAASWGLSDDCMIQRYSD